MGGSTIEKEIVREMFSVGVKLSKDMLSKCVAIATNHKIDATQLAETWEAHSLNSNFDQLNENSFSSYRALVLKECQKNQASKFKANSRTPPTKTMKRTAVVSRSAMSKRSAPNGSGRIDDDAQTLSPTKRIKAEQSHSQLEQILNSSSASSAIASSPQRDESGGTSSASSAVITPPKSGPKPSTFTYENRKNAGTTIVTYNPNNLPPLTTSTSANASKRICAITQPFSHVGSTYKYMTDACRHKHLNSQLEKMAHEMIQAYDIPLPNDDGDDQESESASTSASTKLASYEHVGVPHQSLQTNIGRICNSAHDGKLNKTTLLLEGSKNGANGTRIELNVDKLPQYSLFQGQIVAVEGYNHSGKRMVAERILEGFDPSANVKADVDSNSDKDFESLDRRCRTKKEILKKMHYGTEEMCQSGEGIKVYAVAGPYTTNKDLDYQPLQDLLGMIDFEKPDVVVMMGPFVDTRQDLVKSGEDLVLEYEDGSKRHVCYETFFAAKIANELEALFEEHPDLKTQFVLVPSMDDAVAEPVFPQPPLDNQLEKIIKLFPETQDMPFGSLCLDSIETAGERKKPQTPTDRRIHLVSNPSTIKINEVTIGFTSLDAYMHMSMESVSAKLPPGSRLARLSEHFIKQRSYYPIFPPAAGNGRDFNLDVTRIDAFAMPVQPDVLILPSLLTSTAMDISNGTTVVNPGHLVKGALGGSFAILDIHPMKKNFLNGDGNEKISHGVKDRIRVEVRRI